MKQLTMPVVALEGPLGRLLLGVPLAVWEVRE